MKKMVQVFLTISLICVAAGVASAQNTTTAQGGGSFLVQCPKATPLHPAAFYSNASEPNYTGPAQMSPAPNLNGVVFDGIDPEHPQYLNNGGQIKCQQVSGGDGYMTEADGNQTFMFSFGPLSGLDNIKKGQPGTLLNTDFNGVYCVTPAGALTQCNYDAFDIQKLGYYNSPLLPSVCNSHSMSPSCATAGSAGITGDALTTDPTFDPNPNRPVNTNAGIADPATIMTVGVLNGNIPAPLIAFDEDDEFFLTLSNVGMIMRPDLFESHTVHFHGYPNASSFYDGVPDATWAINIGASATYYYLAPDAGTYFWHCHITPPEHLQMGMVGQLYVRPRQNRVPSGTSLYSSLSGNAAPGTPGAGQQSDLRTACPGTGTPTVANYANSIFGPGSLDLLCSTPLPIQNLATASQQVDPFAGLDPRIPAGTLQKYAYNDGDGSTAYEIDVPIQIHGFDPNFHFVGMTFNPEGFADMKDKYFLLNGRSYPDTVGVVDTAGGPTTNEAIAKGNPDPTTNAIGTEDSDGRTRYSQPLPTLVTLKRGERALLRIADLDVTEYQTLASLGIPMQLVGFQAKLLRDLAGNNMYVTTNSVTLGGGESLDVILDTCTNRTSPTTCATGALIPQGTYFLYTPNLDHLSNDAENFGGLMTEVVVTN